jgi:hypothetical protein
VDFGVLNENLIKGLISCVKYISRFLMKVQMYSLIHHLNESTHPKAFVSSPLHLLVRFG